LTSTPLDGREILRAKMIGPIWGFKPVAYLLLALWSAGMVLGSIHPLGVLFIAIEFAAFTWFATTLGTFFSLRAKNSMRSLATTMATLIFLNGGYLFCCIPMRADSVMTATFCTPALITVALVSGRDLDRLGMGRSNDGGEWVVASVLGVAFYALVGLGLFAAMNSSFDKIVDRPDRLRQILTPAQLKEWKKGRSKEIVYPDELA
jgi:hypothetical protein